MFAALSIGLRRLPNAEKAGLIAKNLEGAFIRRAAIRIRCALFDGAFPVEAKLIGRADARVFGAGRSLETAIGGAAIAGLRIAIIAFLLTLEEAIAADGCDPIEARVEVCIVKVELLGVPAARAQREREADQPKQLKTPSSHSSFRPLHINTPHVELI